LAAVLAVQRRSSLPELLLLRLLLLLLRQCPPVLQLAISCVGPLLSR
jgi:hypothetical protein